MFSRILNNNLNNDLSVLTQTYQESFKVLTLVNLFATLLLVAIGKSRCNSVYIIVLKRDTKIQKTMEFFFKVFIMTVQQADYHCYCNFFLLK